MWAQHIVFRKKGKKLIKCSSENTLRLSLEIVKSKEDR